MKLGKVISLTIAAARPVTVAIQGIIAALEDDGVVDEMEAAAIAVDVLDAAGYTGRLSEDTIAAIVAAAVAVVMDLGAFHAQNRRRRVRLPDLRIHKRQQQDT